MAKRQRELAALSIFRDFIGPQNNSWKRADSANYKITNLRRREGKMVERERKRRKGEEEVSPLCVDPRRRTCSPASGRPFKGSSHHPLSRVSSRPLLIVDSRFDGTNEMFFNSRYPALKHVSLSETNSRCHSQKTTDFAAQGRGTLSSSLENSSGFN